MAQKARPPARWSTCVRFRRRKELEGTYERKEMRPPGLLYGFIVVLYGFLVVLYGFIGVLYGFIGVLYGFIGVLYGFIGVLLTPSRLNRD